MNKNFYVIDTANIFYRCYWGTDMLTNSKGQAVNALHGFINSINQLVKDKKPDYIAFALESKKPSFRKSLSDGYKANRPDLPVELKTQLDLLPSLLDGLNYPKFEIEGYEGDDVIGTLAQLGQNHGLNVTIVSCDKDFNQLINDNVNILNPAKDIIISEHDVMNKFGISPNQFVDYLAIVGDSSDGFKGVEGIGPVGAAKLLQQYGDLNRIYQNISQIKGSTQAKLIKSEASAFLSQSLAKIVSTAPLTIAMPNDILFKGHNEEILKKFLLEQELNHHYNMIFGRGMTGEDQLLGKATY